MPSTTINVYDRPTYQTEKVKGWDVVRMFKGSGLTSESNVGYIEVAEGSNIIQNFTQTLASNYKGTNLIDLTKLENFDSIRLRMNGLFYDSPSGAWFNFYLKIFDNGYNLITDFASNYGNVVDSYVTGTGIYQDWYLDIELTFFIDDSGNYNFVVNGNCSISLSTDVNARDNVSLIPFNGQMNLGTNSQVYIDLSPWNGSGDKYIIKSVNIDFVE